MPNETEHPLSAGQLLIWTGQQLHPGVPLYNMVLAFELRGPLDEDRFAAAFRALVASGDALRTTVVEREGQPVARVHPRLEVPLERLDASAEPDPEAHVQRWMRARAQRTFRLDERLVDAGLLRLGPERHVWYLAQHHLICDAWSTALCLERLAAFYEDPQAEPGGHPRFVDQVRAQLERGDSAATERARAFWADRAEPSPTRFYGNAGTSGGLRSARTERVVLELGAERSARLRAAAEGRGAGVLGADAAAFVRFATVLLALMRRVGAEPPTEGEVRRLALLAPVHGRATRVQKQTLGLFMEVLPLAVDVAGDATFASLQAGVERGWRELLVHALPGSGTAASTRACDVLLNYIPSVFVDLGPLEVHPQWIHPDHGDPAHALRLQVHDFSGSGAFVLHFDVHCEVFGTRERADLLGHFLTLLDAYLDDPEQSLWRPDLVGAAERERRVVAFNRTGARWEHATVLDAIAAQTARRPGAEALRWDGGRLDYAGLDAVVEVLARRVEGVRGAGAPGGGPAQAPVALLLERSPEFVVSLLAVLRTGAPYLPIDPELPAARVAALLEASGACAVATTDALAEQLLAGVEVPRVRVGPQDLATSSVPDERARPGPAPAPSPAPSPGDLAYLIYTSGSTGAPKGVAIEHGALANYVLWARGQYAPDGPVDVALHSPVGVDLTVTSIFLPLVSGGAIAVYAPDGRHDLSVLRVFAEDAVDLVKLTPAHLALLLADGAGTVPPRRIRTLVVGGEDLRRGLAERALDRLGGHLALYNEYGPTEATVGCLIHRYEPERDTGVSVPIGAPIANTRVYLLDGVQPGADPAAVGRPVPAGVPGELWIGGAGLARGYLNDPDQSAAAFRPDPFRPGERIYRTGDLAREDPSTGRLVYLGRRDHQVKIRGSRVELAELEAALERQPGVEAAAARLFEREQAEAAGGDGPDGPYGPYGPGGPDPSELTFCVRCGLASNHPEARLDQAGVCAVCHQFEAYRTRAEGYFRTLDELRELFEGVRSQPGPDGRRKPDCLMLLSGGKDSTYALYQLVELGLHPLVFSLDNGYISDHAKANIQRVVADLGLELVFASTPSMNAIFADSLRRFSNVCQGCFKTIYTLATSLAHERGIRHVVTGLSRGQIFETRLAGFFRMGVDDPDTIDRLVLEARKSYHRLDDAVARQLDVSLFADDAVFDDVRFVDFYRYCDAPLDEVLRFIREQAAWTRPADTGRSTNCLINDTGIFVHKRTRGFHNYALPYSWDVRLGHKTRDECLDELNDRIDEERVHRTLQEVGFSMGAALGAAAAGGQRLVAYYVEGNGAGVEPSALRAALEAELPDFMVPATLVPLEALPLTPQGKLDRAALPAPGESEAGGRDYEAPRTELEQALARIWEELLGVRPVGVRDNFLELGGDSIVSLQIAGRARPLGIRLLPKQLFSHPTVAELAEVAASNGSRLGGGAGAGANGQEVDAGPVVGPAPLTPVQREFLSGDPTDPAHFAQWVAVGPVEAGGPGRGLDRTALERAVELLEGHHDALRLGFEREEGSAVVAWKQTLLPPGAAGAFRASEHAVSGAPGDLRRVAEELSARIDLGVGRMLAAGLVQPPGGEPRAVLVVHHLAVDAVSWGPLLEDLDRAYAAALEGRAAELPPKTTSWQAWARQLEQAAGSAALAAESERWLEGEGQAALALPLDAPDSLETGARWGRAADEAAVTVRSSEQAVLAAQASGPVSSGSSGASARGSSAALADLTLAALVHAVGEWSSAGGEAGRRLHVELEGHGRAGTPGDETEPNGFPADTSRTVGWFTVLYPLALEPGATPVDTLRAVRAAQGAVPGGGHGFGLLRHAHPDGAVRARFGGLPRPAVRFNFLGRSVPFRGAALRQEGQLGLVRGPRGERPVLLDAHAWVHDGRLELHLGYSARLHRRETIVALAERALAVFEQLARSAPAPVASDFPTADLSQGELDDLLEEFGD